MSCLNVLFLYVHRPQHLTGIQLICDICQGKLTGGTVGSKEIIFHPGAVKAGDYLADTHTAGLVNDQLVLLNLHIYCFKF